MYIYNIELVVSCQGIVFNIKLSNKCFLIQA